MSPSVTDDADTPVQPSEVTSDAPPNVPAALSPVPSVLVGIAAGALFVVGSVPLSRSLALLTASESPNSGSLGLRVVSASALCLAPAVAVAAGRMVHYGRNVQSLSDTSRTKGRVSGLVLMTCLGWLAGMYLGVLFGRAAQVWGDPGGIDFVLTIVLCTGALSAFAALLTAVRGIERATRRDRSG